MKCRLCDRPTTPGTGKLCFDCTKSLHRARARSATVRRASAPPVHGAGMAAAGGALAIGPTSIAVPGWRRLGTWAAACLAAIGIVYGFLQLESVRRWTLYEPDVDVQVVSPNRKAPASRVQAHPAETPNTSPAAQPRAELNAANGSAHSAGGRTGLRSQGASAGATRDPNTSSGAYPPANSASGRLSAHAEPEGTQQVPRANLAQAALAADGAQTLASMSEQCGKEAFLSRFICEQKMHMQYCADKWEKDPRCMRRTGSN